MKATHAAYDEQDGGLSGTVRALHRALEYGCTWSVTAACDMNDGGH